MFKKSKQNLNGFTLIELMVMVTIIAIIATAMTITFSAVRLKTRDAKRLSNIQQISQALEDYYFDENSYPSAITSKQALVGSTSGKTYLSSIPSNPAPRTDGSCPDSDYSYTQDSSGTSYHLSFCLGSSLNELSSGTHYATPVGIK